MRGHTAYEKVWIEVVFSGPSLAQRQKLLSPLENQWASAANSPLKSLTNSLFDTFNAKESLYVALLTSHTLEWADAEIKQKQ